MSRRRGESARLAIVSLALSLVVGVLMGVASKPFEGWGQRNWPWTLVLLAVVVVIWLILQARADLGPEDDLDAVAAQLAELVDEDWHREAAVRRLDLHAGLVPFRWTLSGFDEDTVVDIPTMMDAFEASGSRRLVITGEPGTGKTSLAVLLTLDLVRRRTETGRGPVPVKLSLANWVPHEQGLMKWLEQELGMQFLFLRNRGRYPPNTIERLLSTRRVLPVLDGLDELSWDAPGGALRPDPIDQINEALVWLPGLIVTCRSEQFRHATRDRAPIRDARQVELQDLNPQKVVDYLSGMMDGLSRWRPVFTALREEPEGRLAEALSTPLMVALAREVYKAPDTGPDELLRTDRFPDAETIRDHLLRRLVPAVFPELPERDRRGGWHGADARRWLRFIAVGMNEREMANIAWWTLPELAGRSQRMLAALLGGGIAAATAGLSFGAVTWLKWGPATGVAAGGVAAAIGGVGMAVPAARNLPIPSELQFGWQGKWQTMLLGSLLAALCGGVTGFLLGGAGGAILVGSVVGVPLGLAYSGAQPDATVRIGSPRMLLRRDRRVVLFFGLAYGLTSGGVGWFLVHPVIGVVFGVCSALCGGLLYGLPWVLALRSAKGRAGVVASVHLFLYTMLLWPRGKTPPPWRLMDFLDEAHRRGVLRRVGPVYQFQHVFLQGELARSES
ncbi:NACHT domain-containing protein [Actinomadura litoris]|uniref:NACHT domain-containing protein n=1 Tax=Actinomadura litoris TaxID=2678616 RepID=A0A7K1L7Y0_9ACTN|nr:NACHT domain-containing protein [Actinomadura litoris]MUN40551.1 NACHT domain-containing protein [Actinomadura litoris]